MAARRRWIGLARKARGSVVVDAGAAKALAQRKSLLATGITGVVGPFEAGDVVAVVGPHGEEVAQGLANYASRDLEKIKGLKTDRFAQVLGEHPYDEVIHADNLVLTD
jgi:glutamate 5-kinase